MSDERWPQISRIYHAAAALEPGARDAYVRDRCAGDEALLADVQSLLRDDSRAERLLDSKLSRMNLVGRRVGVYEIQSLLGAGGMGEVYRARDTKLGRDVAIKVLPRDFAGDADRLSRLEREARVLASLSHPHIAVIHGVEEIDGGPALVLELVEGETLAERIARGPIPISQALTIARQIAEALEAAHEVERLAELFPAPGAFTIICGYDVTADDQHFLFNIADNALPTSPITIVSNWLAELKKDTKD